MPEYTKPRPAVVLLERYEKIGGWIYLPVFFIVLPMAATVALLILGVNVMRMDMQVYLNVALELLSCILLAALLHRFLGRAFRQARRFPGRFVIAVVAGTAIFFLGTGIMGYLIELIEPGLENVNNNTIMEMTGENLVLMLVDTVLLAPMVEELLFRGVIFTSIRPRSRFWAYAVSMVGFALIHVMGYVGQYPLHTLLLCLVQYLPAGFALAWVLEYSGSIWACIAMHMICNTLSMAVLLLWG